LDASVGRGGGEDEKRGLPICRWEVRKSPLSGKGGAEYSSLIKGGTDVDQAKKRRIRKQGSSR